MTTFVWLWYVAYSPSLECMYKHRAQSSSASMQSKCTASSFLSCVIDKVNAFAHQKISCVLACLVILRCSSQQKQALPTTVYTYHDSEEARKCLEYKLHVRRKTFNSILRWVNIPRVAICALHKLQTTRWAAPCEKTVFLWTLSDTCGRFEEEHTASPRSRLRDRSILLAMVFVRKHSACCRFANQRCGATSGWRWFLRLLWFFHLSVIILPEIRYHSMVVNLIKVWPWPWFRVYWEAWIKVVLRLFVDLPRDWRVSSKPERLELNTLFRKHEWYSDLFSLTNLLPLVIA